MAENEEDLDEEDDGEDAEAEEAEIDGFSKVQKALIITVLAELIELAEIEDDEKGRIGNDGKRFKARYLERRDPLWMENFRFISRLSRASNVLELYVECLEKTPQSPINLLKD